MFPGKKLVKKILGRLASLLLGNYPPFIQLYKKVNNPQPIFRNVRLGRTTKVNSPACLVNSSLGDFSYIAVNSNISDTDIGKFCSIGPNFMCGWGIHPIHSLSTSPMFYSTKKQNGVTVSVTDKIDERKKITIGNDVFIGMNVCVLDGVTIGDGVVVGAGAIVSKDLPPYSVAFGNPARVVKYRFTEEEIEALLRIKWWDFDDERLLDVEVYFENINEFIKKYDSK